MDTILKEIRDLKELILEQNILKKDVLNFNETARYLDVSHSHLYKLTSGGKIPFHKPNNKKLYFSRQELDKWLMQNKHYSQDEIEQEANEYLIKKGRIKI